MPNLALDQSTNSTKRKRFPTALWVGLGIVVVVGAWFGWTKYEAQQETNRYQTAMARIDAANDRQDYNSVIATTQQYLEGKHTVARTYQMTVLEAYAYDSVNQHEKCIALMKQAEAMNSGISDSFLHGTLAYDYAHNNETAQAIAEFKLGIADAKADNDPTTAANVVAYQQQIDLLEKRQ